VTSKLKVLGDCSGHHHLQEADAYYDGPNTDNTACYKLADSLEKVAEPKNSRLVRSTYMAVGAGRGRRGGGETVVAAAAARHRSL